MATRTRTRTATAGIAFIETVRTTTRTDRALNCYDRPSTKATDRASKPDVMTETRADAATGRRQVCIARERQAIRRRLIAASINTTSAKAFSAAIRMERTASTKSIITATISTARDRVER